MKIDLFLNATALNYLSCKRHYQVSALWGYSGYTSDSANLGTDFHRFAYFFEGPRKLGVMDQAMSPGTGFRENDKKLQEMCVMYEACNPLIGREPIVDDHGVPCLEYQFHIKDYISTDKYNIHLVGTIDRADRFQDAVCIVDRKTSAKTKKEDVLSNYILQIQVPFYMWAWKEFLLPKAFTNLSQNTPLLGQYLGIFHSFSPPKFELSNVIAYTPYLKAEVEDIVLTAARDMIAIADLGEQLAPPTGMSTKISGDETVCKYCFLRKLCSVRNHEQLIGYLKTLTSTPYDPRNWR
jgi:hypothetical protein